MQNRLHCSSLDALGVGVMVKVMETLELGEGLGVAVLLTLGTELPLTLGEMEAVADGVVLGLLMALRDAVPLRLIVAVGVPVRLVVAVAGWLAVREGVVLRKAVEVSVADGVGLLDGTVLAEVLGLHVALTVQLVVRDGELDGVAVGVAVYTWLLVTYRPLQACRFSLELARPSTKL